MYISLIKHTTYSSAPNLHVPGPRSLTPYAPPLPLPNAATNNKIPNVNAANDKIANVNVVGNDGIC